MGDEFGWTARDDVAMHKIGDSLEADMNPGATVMWFGEHEGARINELTEEYRRHLEHRSYWTWTPDVWQKLMNIYYETCLNANFGQVAAIQRLAQTISGLARPGQKSPVGHCLVRKVQGP